jgi:peptidoglycan/LPS O-acetylase OafA/YrhL
LQAKVQAREPVLAAHTPAIRTARGGALDALRFLAATFIVVFHLGDDAPVPLRQIHDIFGRGYLATDFFLMLSGFVLASIYGDQVLSGRVSPAQFFVKRAARNYPAHLITLSVLIAMVLFAGAVGRGLSHPERFPWAAVPIHLLMLHGWGFAPDTWNAPTWSISALFLCYAGFPWLWPLFQQLKRPFSCLAVCLGILASGDVAAHALAGQPLFDLPFQWGLFRTIPLFLAGLSLARLVQTASLGARAGSLALAGAATLALNVIALGPDAVSILAICTVIAGCGAMSDGPRWPGAAWGARISFSLFFTHTPADALYNDGLRPLLMKLAPDLAGRWAIWWGGLAFAFAVAVAYHYLIDQPLQRRLSAVLLKGYPVRGLAPAPSA